MMIVNASVKLTAARQTGHRYGDLRLVTRRRSPRPAARPATHFCLTAPAASISPGHRQRRGRPPQAPTTRRGAPRAGHRHVPSSGGTSSQIEARSTSSVTKVKEIPPWFEHSRGRLGMTDTEAWADGPLPRGVSPVWLVCSRGGRRCPMDRSRSPASRRVGEKSEDSEGRARRALPGVRQQWRNSVLPARTLDSSRTFQYCRWLAR
jgi:hypothetical protein